MFSNLRLTFVCMCLVVLALSEPALSGQDFTATGPGQDVQHEPPTRNSDQEAAPVPAGEDITRKVVESVAFDRTDGLAGNGLGDIRTEEAVNLGNIQKVEQRTRAPQGAQDEGGGEGGSLYDAPAEETVQLIRAKMLAGRVEDAGAQREKVKDEEKGETELPLVGDGDGVYAGNGVEFLGTLISPADELFENSNEKYVASVQQLASRKEDEMTRTADIISRPSLACEEMDCIGEAVLKAEMFVKPQSEELRRNKIESETSLKHLGKSSAQQQDRISASLESESLNVENALKEAESLQGEAINATLEAIDNLEEARIVAKDSTRLELINALKESSQLESLKRKEETKEKLGAILTMLESESENKDPVFSTDSWANAGYSIHSPLDAEKSLEAIQHIPLHTYLLRDDSKIDVMVRSNSFDHRRTRRHVGVIDSDGASMWIPESDDAGSIDASTVFAYNLKALSRLMGNIESFRTKLQTLANLPRKSTFGTRISGIGEIVAPTEVSEEDGTKKWKSSAQLASETTALEAEASVSEMKLMSQRFKAVTKSFISESKHNIRMTVLQETDVSTAKNVETAKVVEDLRDTEIAFTEALLDTAIHQITTTGKVISMKNDTFRELIRLREASIGEAERARERIISEAKLERETETTSILRIRIIGEEATKATIEIIKVAFQNVAEAVHHTFKTEQGRQQIVVFIIGACLLAFCIVLSREIFVLGFSLIRKELMTPKLVREYGRSSRRTSASTILGNASIFLAKEVEERVEGICAGTALARERGAPLRHVLIYGRPGTGKSETAKAIGSGISGLPFAIMSGSDLAPLGKHGPAELRKILTWAKRNRSGAMLIIDEAEAALGKRLRKGGDAVGGAVTGTKEDGSGEGYARDSLNVLLSMTGSASCELMLVLTTSNPQALDEAILDRMDELVELELPSRKERRRILENSFSKRFRLPGSERRHRMRMPFVGAARDSRLLTETSFELETSLDRLSADNMTQGCSGRELDKMLQSVITNVYGDVNGNGLLTQALWTSVTTSYCEDLKKKWQLLGNKRSGGRKVDPILLFRGEVPELSRTE